MACLKVIIAGGATGGHLFPGIAIAWEFIERDPETKICFVSTGNELERKTLSDTPFMLKPIKAGGLKGLGIFRKIGSITAVFKGICGSVHIIRDFDPDIVIGVGGYASAPVIIGAWLMKKTTVIHEQNFLAGMANKKLSKFAKRVFVSFEHTKCTFNNRKTEVTGNPVRKQILEEKAVSKRQKFNILVLGGSQGAQSINRVMTEAVKQIKDKDKLYIVHQTGAKDHAYVRQAYEKNLQNFEVKPFFSDMEDKYRQADMVICRAGATTIAEITAVGKPAVFIPFPFAADNHQVLNAKVLADEGAADMILEDGLTPDVIAEKIEHYRAKPDILIAMAKKAKERGRPHAAKVIVDRCLDLLKI